MSKTQALGRLLRPETVAVIGGDSAVEVVQQCRAVGFEGDILAVNPSRDEIAGIPCVASVADLPVVPDASFVAVPPEASLGIIRELSALGAPGAICFAAGFSETGAQGAELEQHLREAAGEMPVIGPNSHGYLNYLDNVALWPDQHGGRSTERGAAVLSQSGNIGINLTMQQRGLDLGYMISVGNCSVLGIHDYIEALLDDDRVTVIGLLIEGINDVAAFSRAAISALEKGVPIVAFKNGRSARGAKVALSHTGSLAGSELLYSALFARLGIARCDTLSQFLETMKFLSLVGTLPARTIGSLSCSGGDASIVADNAAPLDLEMPALSAESAKRLQALLGPNVAVTNPLDYHLYIWANLEKLSTCFTELLSNACACTLLVLDYPAGNDANWQITEQALVAAIEATGQRAVIVASLPETMPESVRERLKTAGIAPMQGIEDCLFAIRAAAIIGEAQADAANISAVMTPQSPIEQVETLDEWAAKGILADAGVDIPRGDTCSIDEVESVAESLGYPVVLKALSPELVHKTEAGAVAINLRNAAGLRTAAGRMAPSFDRFLVEQMVEPVVAEMIVGATRDPAFGLTLLIGSGGTLVELLDDTVALLLPVRRSEIDAAVASLKVNRLIDAYRGGAAGNRDAMLDAIEAIAAYAVEEADTLQELDVNPLLVTSEAAIAADVLIRKAGRAR